MTLKAIIVDDDSSMRMIVNRFLSELGFEDIVEASTSNEARTLIPKIKPNLIFYDTEGLGELGYDLCKAIKQEPYGKNIATIGSSGNMINHQEKWNQSGVDYTLAKPFTLETFSDAVKEAMDKYHSEVATK